MKTPDQIIQEQNSVSFKTKIWNFLKKHGPTFLVGVGVGTGVTFVAMKTSTAHKQEQEALGETADNVVSLQEQIG